MTTSLPQPPWRRAAAGAGLVRPDGGIAASIFAEMSALATRTGAINLGQGFPDEDGPPEVLEAARAAITDGVNQYPPGRGIAALREAVAAHQSRWYGIDADPETEVLVTAGATEALAATLLAFVEPGDEVVVLEPYYDAYAGLVALAGGRLVPVPLEWPSFAPDHDRLRSAITDRTRIILITDPHNPTGAVLDAATQRVLVELAERHDALLVTDEVYEHVRFDSRHVPLASLPGARDRTITISSGGKTFNTTGWKVGWAIAPADLITAILSVKQFLTYVNGAPFQPAIAAGLALPDAYFTHLADDLRAKRDLLVDGLRTAGFALSVPAGSYFVVADARPLGFDDAVDFCRVLPEGTGVVAIPVAAFTSPESASRYRSLVRFAFCKRLDVIEEASRRLAGLSSDA